MCGDMLVLVGRQSQENIILGIKDQPWMARPLREQIKQFQDTQIVKEFTDA
jgi:hypothetical protein